LVLQIFKSSSSGGGGGGSTSGGGSSGSGSGSAHEAAPSMIYMIYEGSSTDRIQQHGSLINQLRTQKRKKERKNL
jgi:hypothetical protein